MSENNEKRKKRSGSRKNIIKDYVVTNIVFLTITLSLTVIMLFAIFSPVQQLVHKVQAACVKQVGDITVEAEQDMSIYDDTSTYGEYVANIVCQSKGLNTDVYIGMNRASASNGAGWDADSAFFTADGLTVASGYDETHFAALKYIEKGDIIEVTTADGVVRYSVKDSLFASGDYNIYELEGDLVLCSSFSDFSENSGKNFYVIADKINGEGE